MLSTMKMRPSPSTSTPVGKVKRYSGSKFVTSRRFSLSATFNRRYSTPRGESSAESPKKVVRCPTVGVVYLHLVLTPIGDVDVTDRRLRQHRWGGAACRGLCPGRPMTSQELTPRRKLLNPVVAPIGHVDAALLVDGYAPGLVELARGRSRDRRRPSETRRHG